MSDPDEVVELVNEDGVVIGTARRGDCHGNPELLHPVVHVLVFRSNGALIMQKRSQGKDIYPGLWDVSAGGHLQVDEEPRKGAPRELREELGIDSFAPMRYLYSYIWRSSVESEMVFTFKSFYTGGFRPDPVEVDEVREFSREEIAAKLGTGFFTPSFEGEWEMYTTYERANPERY